MRCLFSFLLFYVAPCSVLTAPSFVGEWSQATNSLPYRYLLHIPYLGKGRIGVAFDSYSFDKNPFPFYSTRNAVDLYVNTNSFLSCVDAAHPDCRRGDPDGDGSPCCQKAALGGVSFSLREAFPAETLVYSASQTIGNGTVRSHLTSAQGSVFSIVATREPTSAVVALTASYTACGTDPRNISLLASLWAEGNRHQPGYDNTCFPAPVAVGCTSTHNVPCDCRAAPGPPQEKIVFATRTGATSPFNTSMPTMAGHSPRGIPKLPHRMRSLARPVVPCRL